ncbi:GNAT family N-acetyltransferase [Microbulbifer guangxiensis]|uniref:GNAT family N-acetyltransferase n=1 Tax=Microbulbifer guangxiensis TaxID=2904249 RepID=UPI001F37C905|nr:GNAT family N-acetyltransferase [Microbulbifer guangxiensis]
MDNSEIRVADWDRDLEQIRLVRETVFIREQRVDPAIEWDDQEAAATHFLAFLEGEPVATGRLTQTGKIGRMAVLPRYRKQGLGSRLLEIICEHARATGLQHVFLHAQCHARHFYANAGFRAVGGEFEEAGIPHIKMEREL